MNQNIPPQESAEQVRELALRFLAPAFRAEPGPAELLVGQLPSPLPFELPLPEQSRIVGSFISSSETMQVVLDTDMSSDEVMDFYTERMQSGGWFEPDILRRQRQHVESGFVQGSRRPGTYRTFCKGQRGPSLGISVFSGENETGKTEVRLHIDTLSRFSPCLQTSEYFIEVARLIPPLIPPAGVQQEAGMGSNSERADTFATLEVTGEVTLPQLSTHYAHQLEQTGWKRTGEGSNDLIAWHTWEFYDTANERWQGVFTLQHVPEMEQQYYTQMHIRWVEPQSK